MILFKSYEFTRYITPFQSLSISLSERDKNTSATWAVSFGAILPVELDTTSYKQDSRCIGKDHILEHLAIAPVKEQSYTIVVLYHLIHKTLYKRSAVRRIEPYPLPPQSLFKPSSEGVMCLVAVSHNLCSGEQGSRSNFPQASTISFGVYHSSVAFALRSKLVFIFCNFFLESASCQTFL